MGNQAEKEQPHYCFHVVHIRVDSSEEERRCRNFITELKEQLAQFLAETTMPRQEAHDTIHEANSQLTWVYHMFDPTSLTLYDSDLKYGVQNRSSPSSSSSPLRQADLVFVVFHLKRTTSSGAGRALSSSSPTRGFDSSAATGDYNRTTIEALERQEAEQAARETDRDRDREGEGEGEGGEESVGGGGGGRRRRRRRRGDGEGDEESVKSTIASGSGREGEKEDGEEDEFDDEEEDLKGEQYYQVVKWALHLLAEKTETTRRAVKRNNVILVLLKEIEAEQEQLCGRHGERKPFPDPPSDHGPIQWNLKPDWREISPSRFVLYPGFPNGDKEMQQRRAGAAPVCSPTMLQLLYKPHSFVQWSMFSINTRPILAFKRYFVSKWNELRQEKTAALLSPSSKP